MLGGISTFLRPLLAVVLVGGVATVMVAPALDMATQRAESRAATSGQAPLRNHPDATPKPSDDPDADPSAEPKPDFETLLRMCLDSRDPDSDACAAAALESGMSYEDFRAKIVAKLEPAPEKKSQPKTEPKTEPKSEPTKKPEPVVTKKTEPVKTTADFATYFEKCLATRDINSDYCFRAEELSGLGPADFEAKFNAKLAAKDSGDFWVWFEKCLDTRDVRSDACVRAQELIGFNDADFLGKFERYLAERDAKSGKAAATPKPSAPSTASGTTLETVLKACGESRSRMSEACLKALVMSGLQPNDFWVKVEAKFGAFH
jgi:hypothetical protein